MNIRREQKCGVERDVAASAVENGVLENWRNENSFSRLRAGIGVPYWHGGDWPQCAVILPLGAVISPLKISPVNFFGKYVTKCQPDFVLVMAAIRAMVVQLLADARRRLPGFRNFPLFSIIFRYFPLKKVLWNGLYRFLREAKVPHRAASIRYGAEIKTDLLFWHGEIEIDL